MYLEIDNEKYKINVIKKARNKNTYIRVNDDLEIVVTTSIFTTSKEIERIINENITSVTKMINKTKAKKNYASSFYYLGHKYDIVYVNSDTISFGNDKVFIGKSVNVDKYLKNEDTKLFKSRLDKVYSEFSRTIPYPTLTIRNMKSRWGVCNTKTHRVTLNLELIRKDIVCLDYVIVHELSHLIHANHSKEFWTLVEENCPDYKKIRKMMKEY